MSLTFVGPVRVATMRILIAVCLLGVVLADLNDEWFSFKKVHKKSYNAAEEVQRRMIWEQNVRYIQEHNLEADMGHHSYWLGMNEFGDLTADEVVSRLNGLRVNESSRGNIEFLAPSNIDMPDQVDWRKQGYVTPVKNQGACGSCWAFSTTGSLEGQHFKKTGQLVSLSEQNLVDCSTREGNHGCHGGLMDRAFLYIKLNGGIDTEESYPYTARDGICRFNKMNVGATVTGFTDIPRGNEMALQQAVATVGPISVAIDASKRSFHFYKHGVYDEPMCSSMRLDHGVLAVGYGTMDGSDYWLVKNSWGETWGDQGYIMMSRNKNNQCGIATQASYPLV